MYNKKIPLRKCVVSQERLPKHDLLRIVKTETGEVVCDLTGKLNGRGAYIKKDLDILNKAISSKALERALECEISEKTYEGIRHQIEQSK